MILVSIATAQEPPPLVGAAPTDAFPAVVTLAAVDDAGEGPNFCSGTLVAPDWVLTAAHCVTHMEALRRSVTPELVVVFGHDLGLPDGVTHVVATDRALVHEDYAAGALLHDLGLVHLAAEVADVEPMPLGVDAPTTCALGEDLRLVGWGAPADEDLDLSVKRVADIPLFDYDATFLYAYDQADGQNACVGDSGGAALRVLADGRHELAGVIAYVSDDDDTPCTGGYTATTRVDVHRAWIDANAPVAGTGLSHGWPEGTCDAGVDKGAGACNAGRVGTGWWPPVVLLLAATRRRCSSRADRAPPGKLRRGRLAEGG